MRELGRFILREEIASTASQKIYFALQIGDGDFRQPAIVRTPHSSAEQSFVHNLANAATILSQVEHNSAPRVLDFRAQDDVWFLATSFHRGVTLAELLRAGKLDGRVAPAIVHEISSLLVQMHAKQFGHFGLLPANILLSHDGKLKSIDFTYAVDFNRPSASREPETIGYRPPEHRNNWAPHQVNVDLYMLGALLYELIGGTPPEESIHFSEELRIERKHLVNFLLRALSPQPSERPANIVQFRHELEMAATADGLSLLPALYSGIAPRKALPGDTRATLTEPTFSPIPLPPRNESEIITARQGEMPPVSDDPRFSLRPTLPPIRKSQEPALGGAIPSAGRVPNQDVVATIAQPKRSSSPASLNRGFSVPPPSSIPLGTPKKSLIPTAKLKKTSAKPAPKLPEPAERATPIHMELPELPETPVIVAAPALDGDSEYPTVRPPGDDEFLAPSLPQLSEPPTEAVALVSDPTSVRNNARFDTFQDDGEIAQEMTAFQARFQKRDADVGRHSKVMAAPALGDLEDDELDILDELTELSGQLPVMDNSASKPIVDDDLDDFLEAPAPVPEPLGERIAHLPKDEPPAGPPANFARRKVDTFYIQVGDGGSDKVGKK